MNLKTFFLTLFTLLFLSGCGSNTDNNTSTDIPGQDEQTGGVQTSKPLSLKGLSLHKGSGFSMYIPSSWNTVPNTSSDIPTPPVGKLELIMTSSKSTQGFANTLVVLSQKIMSQTTSKEYSLVNNVGAKNEYTAYYPLSQNTFTFDDGEESIVYTFNAKYSASTPTFTFVQTAYVCKNKSYFFTIALSQTTQSTTKYETMLKKFSCK